jgi:hypothetical protein
MKRPGYFFLLVALLGCRDRYNIPFASPQTGYLVVEGMINPAGKTTIALTRTTPLSAKKPVPENGATIRIEGEDNSTYDLLSSDSSQYESNELNLNPATRYRIHIFTLNGKEYTSAYQMPNFTPAIDSISWKRNNGVELFINTHNSDESSRYYKWDYEETWEFHSKFVSSAQYVITYDGDIVVSAYVKPYPGGPDYSIYRCWQFRNPSLIRLGTTAGLSSNTVSYSILKYPEASEELSVLYSIRVKQWALSKEAYDFFGRMKKNTESLGSIFDAQPSEIRGNIINVSDPSEVVIGFVDVASTTETRKYISNAELPNWHYSPNCGEPTMYPNHKDTVMMLFNAGIYPVNAGDGPPIAIPKAFTAAPNKCVKCTEFGTNVKPAYWP